MAVRTEADYKQQLVALLPPGPAWEVDQAPAIHALLDGLNWMGLDWQGEPIFQFARMTRHAEVATGLLATGGFDVAFIAMHGAGGEDGAHGAVLAVRVVRGPRGEARALVGRRPSARRTIVRRGR